MRIASLLFWAGVALVVAAPGAAAQGGMSTELFIARNSALANGSMYGLGVTFGGGPLALRASAAADFRARDTRTGESIEVDAWTGEADLVLQPDFLGGFGAVLPLAPYVFGGLGVVSLRDVDGTRERWTGVSYGGGLAVPMTRAIAGTAEARYRLPLSEALDESASGLDSSFPRGWEYRFGLSISLGR